MKNTRGKKIKLLNAIQEGHISPEALQPPRIYIFEERTDIPGIYVHEGKEYNETEYREFCDKIKSKRNDSIIWDEVKDYVKEDTIIKICRSGRSNDTSGRKVTLDLSK